jgi:hypothetical protein
MGRAEARNTCADCTPRISQVNLLIYRLRPLPGAILIGLPIGVVAAAWWLGPRLGGKEAITFIQVAAAVLGLVSAFTVSRDIDPPEPTLAAAPHPYWRTPTVRVLLWLIVAGIIVGLTGEMVEARSLNPSPMDTAVTLAHADLVLVTGLAFALSIALRSFTGGAATVMGLVLCASAQRLWRGWPLRILDTAGAPGWDQTRTWLLLTGAAFAGAGLFYLRSRGLHRFFAS